MQGTNLMRRTLVPPIGAVTVIALAAGLILVYQLPIWLDGNTLHRLGDKDRIAAEAALHGQITPLLTALTAAAGAYLAARKFGHESDARKTDRLNTAVAHLNSDDPPTQTGGAWALSTVMQDSPVHRHAGRKVLTHYLRYHTGTRSNSPAATPDPDTIRNVLEVLRSLPQPGFSTSRDAPLDLTGIRISHADMHEIHLPKAQLACAHLPAADLHRAHLRSADCEKITLTDADLRDADLRGARLHGALLNNADLAGANLSGADLTDAVFTGANLDHTDLTGTDLRHVTGLTREQITSAHTDKTAQFPTSTLKSRLWISACLRIIGI